MHGKSFTEESLQIFVDKNSQRLSYDSWASVEKKFFYINIPKAGCTIVKKMLQALCGLPVPSGVNPIHSRTNDTFVKSLCDYDLKDQLYLLNSNDVNRICITRNPYTRMLSGYWNKVAGPKKYSNIEEAIFLHLGIDYSDRTPSFAEFVQFVMESSDEQLDIHFRSQSSICHFDRVSYNLIGHFETLQEDLIRIFGELGAHQSVLNRVTEIENPSLSDTSLRSPLLEQLRQTGKHIQLFEFFKSDFLNFHYARI